MSELQERFKRTLNAAQYEAAVFKDGPAVIMAGAGSGKTHTLISRVANLVDSGVQPERILMLTFTNAAANEMKERASNLLDKRCGNILACTYHKFCNMMLRRFSRELNLGEYSILSYPEFKNMIDYVKSSNSMFDNLKGFPSAGVMADIISISVNKSMDIYDIIFNTEKYHKFCNYISEIETLADEVAVYGYQNKKFTYDDLLVYMNKALDNPAICSTIAHRYQYIMVDEFQDTNSLQEKIILKIANFNKNIVVVGDISQSIYAFRGADVRNIQSFNTKLPDCKTIVLDTNYRSTQEILDFANEVMNHNVNSWTYYDMRACNKNGAKPVIVKTVDNHTEADYVFNLIQDYHQKQGIPYSEIAVLERSSMMSFELENLLVQNEIQYRKLGGIKFMDYDCIGDMLAYFNIIVNPHDLLSWFRVLQLHPHIGKSFAKKVADNCNQRDFLTNNSYKSRKFYPELIMLSNAYDKFRVHQDFYILFDDVEKFYFDTRERALLLSRMKDDAKEEERESIENDKLAVQVLKSMASKYENIVEFVDDIILDSMTEESTTDDLFTISTVHSAKGLEWSVVIILDCIEGAFPRVRPEDYGTEEDEEELRCFYVAITRAKNNLYLIAPEYRMMGGGIEQTKMSHYLDEINYSSVTMQSDKK